MGKVRGLPSDLGVSPIYIRSAPRYHSVPGRFSRDEVQPGAKGGEGVPHNRARADEAQTLGARREAKSPPFVRNITLFSAESARLFPQKHTLLIEGALLLRKYTQTLGIVDHDDFLNRHSTQKSTASRREKGV